MATNPNPNSSSNTEETPSPSAPPSSNIGIKWWGFVSALWVQCVSGNNYTFSNYSVELKAVLGCNQVELNGLSSAKDVGKAFGVFAGILSDYFPPWSILLIGSIEGLVGYGVQWLVISQRISPLPYWLMCVVMCMGGNSTTWMNTAVLVTCVRNFRQNRGPAAGILKAYIGLSTAIFTDICAALFTGNASTFVLMLAILPLAVCVIAMFLLHPIPDTTIGTGLPSKEEEREESRCFAFLNSAAIVLAIYLLAFDLSGVSNDVVLKLVAAGIVVLLVTPAVLPIYLSLKMSARKHGHGSEDETAGLKEPLLKNSSSSSVEAKEDECDEENNAAIAQSGSAVSVSVVPEEMDAPSLPKKKKKKQVGEDHTVLEALQTVDFWLLFFCFLCGVGTGMAVSNNMGQIGESLGYSSVSIFISMISIWGFFGRLGSGALSEWLIRWKGIPRPALLAASQLVMVGGYALLAVGVSGSLFVGSIVVGICYGVRLAVSVPTVSELFGLKVFGLMYNLLILNLPLGSFLFSSLLAGFLYDREAAKDGSSTTCVGVHCYRVVFIVMAGVSALGFFLDVLLTLRTRALYASIQRSKLAASGTGSSSSPKRSQ